MAFQFWEFYHYYKKFIKIISYNITITFFRFLRFFPRKIFYPKSIYENVTTFCEYVTVFY